MSGWRPGALSGHRAVLVAFVAGVVAVAGCRCGDRVSERASYDAGRQRRVIQPPGEVRPVPPHAIHADGVGPYLFGMSFKDVLELLPHGPRVVLLQIDGVLDYSLVRAESDGMLIGVERPRGVTFLSVLDAEIARIETGVGVGTPAGELVGGGVAVSGLGVPDWAADPRLLRGVKLPGTRFVIEEDHVAAVLVQQADRFAPVRPELRPEPRSGAAPGAASGVHPREPAVDPARDAAREDACDVSAIAAFEGEVIDSARLGEDAVGVVFGCFGGPTADAIVYSRTRAMLIAGEPGKWRRSSWIGLSDVVWAAPLDLERDGRHEVAVVAQDESDEHRTIRLELLRVDAGRLARVDDTRVLYRVSEGGVAGTGARMSEIDLLIELEVYADGIRAGGVFVQRGRDRPRTVAPLLPTDVVLKRKRAASGGGGDSSSSAPADAGPDAADAGTASLGIDLDAGSIIRRLDPRRPD